MLGTLLAISALIAFIWHYATNYRYWKRKNVPQSRFPLPLVGDHLAQFTKKKSFAQFALDLYTMFPGTRYSGFYQGTTPVLLIKDPELLKQISVKYFDHFTDHRNILPEDVEPLWSKNLFTLKGERWRHMRATLSPSFTSSKMKQMFVLISECSVNFVDHFKTKTKNNETLTLDMKDALTRFTTDVIATTAFGIKCDSLADRNNKFYEMGKKVTDFSGFWKNVKFFIAVVSPKLGNLVGVRLFDAEVTDFFSGIITETIKTREEKNIVRPDMIHLLMEAKKGKVKPQEEAPIEDTGFATVEEHIKPVEQIVLTDMDIAAQALIFFFAGFDSVAGLMAFATYEIAVNPDIQTRLRQEVDETFDKCNGTVTYEALMKMKYLDMVLSETLRKWPIAVGVDRVCVKPYTIPPEKPDEEPLKLNAGDLLWIPIFGIHRDERFYPNPEKFDPERFNDENKSDVNPYTYLPFGVGPRNCIGSRFALLETKLICFHILRNFTLVPVEKTQIPMKLSKQSFNLLAENGHWLGLHPR